MTNKRHIVYFHRNKVAGYSINKVTQTIIREINDKEEFYVPYSGASLLAIIKNVIYVYHHRNKEGINHITGDIYYCVLGLIGCKSVLTYHDTVSLDYRKLPLIKRLIIEWLWYRLPLLLASHVVAISNETKVKLSKYSSRNDIVVIHNAIDPVFKRHQPSVNDLPIILLIGTSENKNLIRTFKALEGIKCKLAIIGPLNIEQESCLRNLKIDYDNYVGLSDIQVLNEYVRSDIVSFISLFEGFGMPVIEANAIGRPVICSSIPVLNEVAGEAALFVNPEDVCEMREGFKCLLSDSILRNNLIEAGFENVKRFDPNSIRDEWQRFYNSIS